jgi:hypothetical protein
VDNCKTGTAFHSSASDQSTNSASPFVASGLSALTTQICRTLLLKNAVMCADKLTHHGLWSVKDWDLVVVVEKSGIESR